MRLEWEPVRIPKQLFIEVKAIIDKTGFWVNEHEFIRDAIREKLTKCQNEALLMEAKL
jgi:metal-responsive CopG/Arc/MetJ family transcriptional regulator